MYWICKEALERKSLPARMAAAHLQEDIVRLAEGATPAEGAQALARIGHRGRHLQPLTALGQPEAAPCPAHQPAHAANLL